MSSVDGECLESGNPDDPCEGPVAFRMPLSGTGKAFPRCEKHWEKRLEVQQGINERYPYHQPSDFDPMDAGEAWGEDDY